MTTVALSKDDPKVLDGLTPHQLFSEIEQIQKQYVYEVPGKRRSWPDLAERCSAVTKAP